MQSEESKSDPIAPWLTKTISGLHPMVALHNEILEFSNYIENEKLKCNRENIVNWITNIAQSRWYDCQVEVFGSYATGIYLPASDIDITIIKSGKSTQSLIDSLYHILKSQGKVEVIDKITKTRVPIIKLIDKATHIHIDISFNNSSQVMVNNIKQITLQYPHFKHIVLIMKYFLKIRDYNDTYRGGIGSTLLQLMVYAYLQYKYKELNYDISKLMLSEVLVDFVRFYSDKLNWSHIAISVFGKGCFVKKDGLYFGSNLSIINPLDVTLDVGKASYNINSVLTAMKKSLNYMLYSVEERKSYLLKFFGSIL